jgi:hypothetical protein
LRKAKEEILNPEPKINRWPGRFHRSSPLYPGRNIHRKQSVEMDKPLKRLDKAGSGK